MYIERVPNRTSPPAILLRESYRDGAKVRKRTLANLSQWPAHLIEGLRTLLRGGTAVDNLEQTFEVVRSRPHGHVAAVLGSLRALDVERLLDPEPGRQRDLVVAMLCARILDPRSKLATARGLNAQTLFSSLGEELGVRSADEDALYEALDWLLARQSGIETRLAKRHLADGALVLYDLSSTYFEGRTCPLAALGHSRDGKKGTLQIVFGLLCDTHGRPLAVEVFEGNTADPKTLAPQLEKLRQRFGLTRIVVVGDRGMLTAARIREELRGVEGLDWITALRAPAIRHLATEGALQLSLFDQQDLAEITHPDYPGERLVVCKNPLLAEERARKREALLAATERELDKLVAATRRPKRRLQGEDKIGLRLGKVLNRFQVGKHFITEITADAFVYRRDTERIAAEAALDGIYVLRTSVADSVLDTAETVTAYKGLSVVERAFRSLKSIDLKVRPIDHHLADRVRAHVFLCMLAYYVEWHMRQRLAPILFDDDDPRTAAALRESPVAPARPSQRAQDKAQRKRTEDGLPVHSFQTLLADLATLVRNQVRVSLPGQDPAQAKAFERLTRPTSLQQRALDLLGVRL